MPVILYICLSDFTAETVTHLVFNCIGAEEALTTTAGPPSDFFSSIMVSIRQVREENRMVLDLILHHNYFFSI